MNSVKVTTKKRVPNFEILRVLAMFFIVVWHFIYHGLLKESSPTYSFTVDGVLNYSVMQIIMVITVMAVNLYVLITGYFMIQSKPKWNKIPHLWFQVFIYSVAIMGGLIGGNHLGVKDLLHNSLVIRYNAYWFVTKYMGLVMLAPFINKCVCNLDRRNYKLLLAVMFLLDFSLYRLFYGGNYSGGQSLFHFVFLYMIAGYVRNWKPFRSVGAAKIGLFLVLAIFTVFAMETLLECLKCICHHEAIALRPTCDLIANNELTLFTSVLFFLWMSKLRINADNCVVKCCMRIAPMTFAVYLIHDNNYVRPILWKWIMANTSLDSSLLYVQIIAYSLGIFVTCVIIDYLLKRLMSCLHVVALIDMLTNRVKTKLNIYLE